MENTNGFSLVKNKGEFSSADHVSTPEQTSQKKLPSTQPQLPPPPQETSSATLKGKQKLTKIVDSVKSGAGSVKSSFQSFAEKTKIGKTKMPSSDLKKPLLEASSYLPASPVRMHAASSYSPPPYSPPPYSPPPYSPPPYSPPPAPVRMHAASSATTTAPPPATREDNWKQDFKEKSQKLLDLIKEKKQVEILDPHLHELENVFYSKEEKIKLDLIYDENDYDLFKELSEELDKLRTKHPPIPAGCIHAINIINQRIQQEMQEFQKDPKGVKFIAIIDEILNTKTSELGELTSLSSIDLYFQARKNLAMNNESINDKTIEEEVKTLIKRAIEFKKAFFIDKYKDEVGVVKRHTSEGVVVFYTERSAQENIDAKELAIWPSEEAGMCYLSKKGEIPQKVRIQDAKKEKKIEMKKHKGYM